MRLYFLRHADALDGMNDAIRPLSPKGHQQCRAIARFLVRAGIVLDAAYSSPLVRAHETAERVLEEGTGLKPAAIQDVDVLLNGASAQRFQAWLRNLSGVKDVLLTGHAPSLGTRVRELVGMGDDAGFDLPKGGLACVKTEDGRSGELKFFVTPKVLGD